MSVDQLTTDADLFGKKMSTFVENINSYSQIQDLPEWIKPLLDHMSSFAVDISAMYTDLKLKFTSLDSCLAVQKRVTDVLVADRDHLQTLVYEIQNKLEDQMQYSRRPCLLVHGLPENDNEDTDKVLLDFFDKSLDAKLISHDLGRSHRLGKKRSAQTARYPTRNSEVKSSPRPIIARFISYRQRKQIYDAKKKLKGQKTLVTESLTKSRYELFKQCRESFGVKNTWTVDGRVGVLQN